MQAFAYFLIVHLHSTVSFIAPQLLMHVHVFRFAYAQIDFLDSLYPSNSTGPVGETAQPQHRPNTDAYLQRPSQYTNTSQGTSQVQAQGLYVLISNIRICYAVALPEKTNSALCNKIVSILMSADLCFSSNGSVHA